MAIRDIVPFPDPILKQRCAEVEVFDAELHQLLDDMADTMGEADGLGLAANQVGVSLRIFVMDVPIDDDTRTGRIEVINPKVKAKRGELKYEEGCLSFPGVHENVIRAAELDLDFVDRHGQPQAVTARGLVSVCIQHELDHLDGITFVDRLSPLKRRIVLRDYLRENRELIEDAQHKARLRARQTGVQG
ncbi:MAG: peptide deformylase [Myxococcota bacterium]